MKMYIGLFMLVMLLVAASGCTTQQAKSSTPATTLTTAVTTTEIPAPVTTTLPKTVPVTVSTKVPAADVTALVTTVATPRPTNTWSIKHITIYIRGNTYVPDQLTVLPGTGVTWINDDSVVHIVKATGDSKGKFTSAEMVNGASFHYTFGEAAGTFEFGDPNYPDMKGTIIVKKGDAIVGD
jgi:plastocyanin